MLSLPPSPPFVVILVPFHPSLSPFPPTVALALDARVHLPFHALRMGSGQRPELGARVEPTPVRTLKKKDPPHPSLRKNPQDFFAMTDGRDFPILFLSSGKHKKTSLKIALSLGKQPLSLNQFIRSQLYCTGFYQGCKPQTP